MRLTVESFDGHDINDSNVSAYIPLEGGNFNNLPSVDPIEIPRINNFPDYGGKILLSKNFMIQVDIKPGADYSTYFELLKGYFDTAVRDKKKLVVKDSDTTKEWYVMCTCVANPERSTGSIKLLMYANDPTLLGNTASTVSWSVTATGQTKVVTPVGNVKARPVFTITPTSAKTGGYAYKKFLNLKNVHTNAFSNYPYDLTDGGLDHAAMVKVAAVHVAINDGAGITDVATTIPYDGEAGTFPTAGIAWIDGATKEQISYTGKSGGNLTGVTRGINGTTAAAHANDVIIYQSNVQADGDDLRIYMDGKEVSRWSDNWNNAATKIWINIDLKPKATTTLKTAIAASGSITSIDLVVNTTTYLFLRAIGASGMVQIGTEIFTYTTLSLTTSQLTGTITRAAKQTSMGAHAVGDAVTFIEHDVWMMYGNAAADAPVQDETKKPIIDLATSTNNSWVYALFGDDANLRTGRWNRQIVSSVGKQSAVYTDNHNALVDPATEMGMSIKAYQSSGRWVGETGYLRWTLFHPAGITHVSSDGESYRNSVSWPLFASLKKGPNASLYLNQWTLTTPASISTWTAWTKNAEALGATYNYIGFVFWGSVGAVANAEADMEVGNVTLTIDSTKRPTISASAEADNYWLDLKLTNSTSGEYLTLALMMGLNRVLTIDCARKVIYYDDNTNMVSGLQLSSVRQTWLDLAPGNNTLKFDDTGTNAVTVAISWEDRNN
ncbi:MAG: hypothetical protein C0391_03940 [Anaerolinea sp.]|nr:hypothetical protein [Anaerolinea sp.]